MKVKIYNELERTECNFCHCLRNEENRLHHIHCESDNSGFNMILCDKCFISFMVKMIKYYKENIHD